MAGSARGRSVAVVEWKRLEVLLLCSGAAAQNRGRFNVFPRQRDGFRNGNSDQSGGSSVSDAGHGDASWSNLLQPDDGDLAA